MRNEKCEPYQAEFVKSCPTSSKDDLLRWLQRARQDGDVLVGFDWARAGASQISQVEPATAEADVVDQAGVAMARVLLALGSQST
ncbi:hypothetical protein NLG97_g878 [Lecanicillium saksenae]|uniref:Uncharacterized protein n=1 Tax=Lecanicillium saksenae TaxID=468837 RepID=A0ACC1R5C5_9HYPO|nr:hypothetical protein NLG97_g878 [Lecanicillium saksenae]